MGMLVNSFSGLLANLLKGVSFCVVSNIDV